MTFFQMIRVLCGAREITLDDAAAWRLCETFVARGLSSGVSAETLFAGLANDTQVIIMARCRVRRKA